MSDIGRALLIVLAVLLFPAKSYANQAYNGFCQDGGIAALIQGISSTNLLQGSFPGCTVTVNVHGGGLATIFGDNIGTPKANPFTASLTDGSFVFYAGNGHYDVNVQASGLNYTYSDVLFNDPSAGTTATVFVPTTLADRKLVAQNPSFEGSSVLPPPGYQVFGTATITYETVSPAPGKNQSVKVSSTVQNSGLQSLTKYAAFTGDTYSFTSMAKSDGTGIPLIEIEFNNAAGTQIGSVNVAGTTSTTWTQLTASGTVPANAINATILLINSAATQPSAVWFDELEPRQTNFLSPILGPNGSAAAPAHSFSNFTNYGLFISQTNNHLQSSRAGIAGAILEDNIWLGSTKNLQWANTVDPNSGSNDTSLSRIGAAVVGAGNGTNGDVSGTYKATSFLAGISSIVGRNGEFSGQVGGNAVFWGHGNTQYVGTIGAYNSAGLLYFCFYCYQASGTNVFNYASSSNLPYQIVVNDSGTTPAGAIRFINAAAGTVDTAITFSTLFQFLNNATPTMTWGTDSGLSRAAAGVFAMGNGTPGDTSGSLNLNAIRVNSGTAQGLTIHGTQVGVNMGSGVNLLWTNGTDTGGTADVTLSRLQPNVLAVGTANTIGDVTGFMNMAGIALNRAANTGASLGYETAGTYRFGSTAVVGFTSGLPSVAIDSAFSRNAAGVVLLGNGTAGSHAASFGANTISDDGTGNFFRLTNLSQSEIMTWNNGTIGWSSAATAAGGARDTGFQRLAPASVALGTGGVGDASGSFSTTNYTSVAQGGATSGANFGAGVFTYGGSAWNGSAAVSLPTTFTYGFSAGSNPNAFFAQNFSANGPLAANIVQWFNQKAATSGANVSSPILEIIGNSWNGSASINEGWQWQDVVGGGSNPISTLNFSHFGSSGTITIQGPQWTGTQVGGGQSAALFALGAGGMAIALKDTTQGADAKTWDFIDSGGQLSGRAVNDANSSATNWVQVSRSGATVTTVQFSPNISGTRINPRVVALADATSITPTSDTADENTFSSSQAAGTLTVNAPSGTPVDAQKLILRLKATNAQTYSFNATYHFSTSVTAPATLAAGKTDYIGIIWNAASSIWDVVAVDQGHTD